MSRSFVLWSLIFFFSGVASAVGAQGIKTAPSAEEVKLVKLNEEIERLMIAMDQFEQLHNRKKYMEMLELASQKNLEADAIWDKTQQAKQGITDGMLGGIFEMYAQHLPQREKISLLAGKYGLKPEQLRKIKSDIEIAFAEEFAEKYSRLPGEASADGDISRMGGTSSSGDKSSERENEPAKS